LRGEQRDKRKASGDMLFHACFFMLAFSCLLFHAWNSRPLKRRRLAGRRSPIPIYAQLGYSGLTDYDEAREHPSPYLLLG
jgi:hypothetical protein